MPDESRPTDAPIPPHRLGLALRPGGDRRRAVEALSALPGLERVAFDDVVPAGLHRRGRRGFFPALSVRAAHTFDAADRRDPRWWPQGIAWPDPPPGASGTSRRRVVGLTWYAKQKQGDPKGGHGCRVTFYDLDTHRYDHALVVVPNLADDGSVTGAPLQVHAGGLVWAGGHLHVAATAKGFHTCRLDDLLRVGDDVPAGVHTAGHRYLLPVHHSWRPETVEGTEKLRYSFFSVDRTGDRHHLLVGEYGRGKQSRRLVWFPLDPATGLPQVGDDGAAHAVRVEQGERQMQGVVAGEGRLHLTSSRGDRTPGSLYTGTPGAFHERRFALPMGPEDLEVDAGGRFWTVTEHPRRRWVVELRTP